AVVLVGLALYVGLWQGSLIGISRSVAQSLEPSLTSSGLPAADSPLRAKVDDKTESDSRDVANDGHQARDVSFADRPEDQRFYYLFIASSGILLVVIVVTILLLLLRVRSPGPYMVGSQMSVAHGDGPHEQHGRLLDARSQLQRRLESLDEEIHHLRGQL